MMLGFMHAGYNSKPVSGRQLHGEVGHRQLGAWLDALGNATRQCNDFQIQAYVKCNKFEQA
jgi:hypothetical protein